jgi:glutathione S-transferase
MITLFDLPSNLPDKVWSPNTWKTRLCLNYKGLAYKTKWVEFHEIEKVYVEGKIPGNAVRPDGSPGPFYSLPAILDLNDEGEEIMIADSLQIARYLDRKYPEPSKKVLASTEDETFIQGQEAFARQAVMAVFPVFPHIFASKTLRTGNEASQKYALERRIGALRKFFSEKYGSITSLDEVTFTDAEKKENFTAFLTKFSAVGKAVQVEGGKVTAWTAGDAISFSDFALAGALFWVRAAVGEESLEWKIVMEWEGGKWASFLGGLEPYTTVA